MAGVSLDSVSNLSPELQKAFQVAVAAERKSVQSIEDRKANIQNKTNLLGDVIGKVEHVKKTLPELSSAGMLREINLLSSDEKALTGIAEKGRATIGNFNIEVLQMASPSAALSNTFPDKNETRVGTGYFSITTASGEEKEIFVDNDNATLEGLVKTINGARLGMRASIITDKTDAEAPYRLLITSEGIGADNDVQYPEFYFVDGEEDFYIEEQREAVNSLIRFEGLEIESPTNTIKDVIPGVTLNARSISNGPVTISIEQDTPRTAKKIKDMVEGLNQVFSFIQDQNKLDEKTPTHKTLGGDYGIRTAETRLRSALTQALSPEDMRKFRALGDIGIQFNRNGTLAYDEKKLHAALTDNFDQVADVLIGDGITDGIVPKLSRTLNTLSGPPGSLLTQQQKNYSTQIDRMQKDIAGKEEVSSKRMENLKQRLARAQEALSSLQQQSGQIAAQLGGARG